MSRLSNILKSMSFLKRNFKENDAKLFQKVEKSDKHLKKTGMLFSRSF